MFMFEPFAPFFFALVEISKFSLTPAFFLIEVFTRRKLNDVWLELDAPNRLTYAGPPHAARGPMIMEDWVRRAQKGNQMASQPADRHRPGPSPTQLLPGRVSVSAGRPRRSPVDGTVYPHLHGAKLYSLCFAPVASGFAAHDVARCPRDGALLAHTVRWERSPPSRNCLAATREHPPKTEWPCWPQNHSGKPGFRYARSRRARDFVTAAAIVRARGCLHGPRASCWPVVPRPRARF